MIRYKVKVYLPNTQGYKKVGDKRLLITHTNWTFVIAETRQIKKVSKKNDDVLNFFYTGCTYVDGSDWMLQDIDAFIDKGDLKMPASFKVFSREYYPCEGNRRL